MELTSPEVLPPNCTVDAAVTAAIHDEMIASPDVVYFCTAPPERLSKSFSADRVVQTPISEHGVTGLAVGAAASGLRPIVSWRNVSFGMSAYDQLTNQAAKLRYMLGGQITLPLVIHTTYGSGKRMAAQHMQTPYSIFASVPGLRVVAPSTTEDAYEIMRQSIRSNDPVVFLEGSQLGTFSLRRAHDAVTSSTASAVRCVGTDVTVVAIGFMVQVALEAGRILSEEGVSIEVIDLMSLSDIDIATVLTSVRKTGRLVVVDEAPSNCSVASEVLAQVAESPGGLTSLVAAPRRINGLSVPMPYSPVLEDAALPNATRVVESIHGVLADGGFRVS
jgi:pyruvate/2-oxoglutarate/acetoin dehydrogenase E1 component